MSLIRATIIWLVISWHSQKEQHWWADIGDHFSALSKGDDLRDRLDSNPICTECLMANITIFDSIEQHISDYFIHIVHSPIGCRVTVHTLSIKWYSEFKNFGFTQCLGGEGVKGFCLIANSSENFQCISQGFWYKCRVTKHNIDCWLVHPKIDQMR